MVIVVEKTLLYKPVLVPVSEGIRQETNSGAKILSIDYTFTPSNLDVSSFILGSKQDQSTIYLKELS